MFIRFGYKKSLDKASWAMLECQIKQLGVAAAGNFILAAVMILAYRDRVPNAALIVFGCASYGVNVLRLIFRHYYFKNCNRFTHDHRWRDFAISISFINGMVWGSWGLYVLTHLPPDQTITMYVILAGITAGAIATSSASRLGFILFILPTLLPLIFYEFFQKTQDSFSLAAVCSLYLVLMISASKKIHDAILENVLSALSKAQIVRDLERKQEENQRLNQELKIKIEKEIEHVKALESANQRSRKLADELLIKSSTDSLTGVANRRALDEILARQWHFALRHQIPIAVIMFDIDWFKRYNDSVGHLEGDRCLRKIARLAADFFQREEDVVSRYGGEEFAILLPGLELNEVRHLAEKFCRHVFERNIPHPDSSEFKRITISAGVASLTPKVDQSATALLGLADTALYESKRDGRNQVNAGLANAS